jgi:hypothetical protein
VLRPSVRPPAVGDLLEFARFTEMARGTYQHNGRRRRRRRRRAYSSHLYPNHAAAVATATAAAVAAAAAVRIGLLCIADCHYMYRWTMLDRLQTTRS